MKFWVKVISVIGAIAAAFCTVSVLSGYVLAIVDDWISTTLALDDERMQKIYRVLSYIANGILVFFAGIGVNHFGNWLISKAFKKELEAAK